jgi:hypothetical protein
MDREAEHMTYEAMVLLAFIAEARNRTELELAEIRPCVKRIEKWFLEDELRRVVEDTGEQSSK